MSSRSSSTTSSIRRALDEAEAKAEAEAEAKYRRKGTTSLRYTPEVPLMMCWTLDPVHPEDFPVCEHFYFTREMGVEQCFPTTKEKEYFPAKFSLLLRVTIRGGSSIFDFAVGWLVGLHQNDGPSEDMSSCNVSLPKPVYAPC
jgi:hypothetical protein